MARNDIRTLAIGEAGLDKLCPTPFELQLKVFQEVIRIAEKSQRPLIIHSVRTSNELIALKKEFNPIQPWIIHGFRGKKELAQSLIRQGFYLSFGAKYNTEALQCTPTDRILIETDEENLPVQVLYSQAASILHTTEKSLTNTIQETINRLFFSR